MTISPPDYTDEDFEELLVQPPPLAEEADAPQLINGLEEGLHVSGLGDPRARRLAALAGPGNAYVFLVFSDEGTSANFAGIAPDLLGHVLLQAALICHSDLAEGAEVAE